MTIAAYEQAADLEALAAAGPATKEDMDARVVEIDRCLAEIDASLDRAALRNAEGRLSDSAFDAYEAKRHDEAAAFRNELANIRGDVSVLARGRSLRERWNDMLVNEKREWTQRIIKRIVVRPASDVDGGKHFPEKRLTVELTGRYPLPQEAISSSSAPSATEYAPPEPLRRAGPPPLLRHRR